MKRKKKSNRKKKAKPKATIGKQKKKGKAQISGSSSSESEIIYDDNSDNEPEEFEDLITAENEAVENETIEEEGENGVNEAKTNNSQKSTHADIQNVKLGNWVVVKYPGKKDIIHYIGKVVEVKDGSIKVNFLRKKGLYFVYPDVEDIEPVLLNAVVAIIHEPTINRGMHFFKVPYISGVTKIY